MSKIETIGKVTLKLPSRINLERRRARARAELSTLDKAHKPPSPPLPVWKGLFSGQEGPIVPTTTINNFRCLMKMKIIRNDKSPLNPSHVRYLHRIKIEGTYLMDYSSIICETTSETRLNTFQKYLRLTYFLVASIKGISMGRMRYPMYWQTLSEFVKRTKCKVKRTRTEQILRYNLVPHLRS